MDEWRAYDPISNMRTYLLESGTIEESVLDQLEEKAQASIDAALEFAKASPEPEILTVLDDVYA